MKNILDKISIFDYRTRNAWMGIAGLYKAAGGSFEEFHQWSMQDPEKYKGEQDCRNAWSISRLFVPLLRLYGSSRN